MPLLELFPGDIILAKGSKWYSKAIKFWTYSSWSHVYYVVSEGIIDITYPRVQLIQYDDVKESCLVLRWAVPFCPADIIKWDWYLKSLVGKKYDLAGLLSFVIHAKVQNKSYYFCSEAGLEAANFVERRIWLRKDPNWITPQDYEESLAFVIIHEGVLPHDWAFKGIL